MTTRRKLAVRVHEDRPAPEVPHSIRVVRDFVNTTDHETGGDDLTSPAELDTFLAIAGLDASGALAGSADLELARVLRQGLRRALELNDSAESWPIQELGVVLPKLHCALSWEGRGARLSPVSSGVTGALTHIVIAVYEAMAAEQWWRLKICGSDECEWAFYDNSKNRSGRWCEYACGDRVKMRAYRERQKAALQL